MATRRPQVPTARPKPGQHRAKAPSSSQTSRPGTAFELEPPGSPSSRSGASTPSAPLQPLNLASPTKGTGTLGNVREEMNVQVVVRCRVRSEREIQDSSPIIVSTQGACGPDVTIETPSPSASLGMIGVPSTKTYTFDRVFGPSADQAMIYKDVLQPVLDEVIAGYNCTVFAYGQTGTGKTYTMQGDLTPSVTGGPGPEAGMIPRALYKLYQYLESSVADYTVKISFVELYNEELRDLLSAHLQAPAGSAQPMGAGSKTQSELKIFDEAGGKKKGVVIQGLEEISAKDYKQAVNLLSKGCYRRQVSATKFNDHSSRSHSVFTVTVHTKETNSSGDDTLRVGKLHLVDLAGSENVGRSGAEDKQAREAGMINQSLLTLGRVINALVDKSPHVPYRESKLTRLLQDSLGGRTKTCIIATVSPARCNMEESLSTLEYALRAKSIRNKPEVNQRMTRNALLKEYVAEIDRLRADLIATREKNGIWFAKENWQEYCAEKEQTKTECVENRRQVEIKDAQLRATKEEYEKATQLLEMERTNLKDTRERLESTEDALKRTTKELSGTRVALEEETVVKDAYVTTETRLDVVASQLKTVATESVADVGGLFGKLDRKANVLSSNSSAVLLHGSNMEAQISQLDNRLRSFAEDHRQRTIAMQQQVMKLNDSESKALANHSTAIKKQMDQLAERVDELRNKDVEETSALDSLTQQVQASTTAMAQLFADWEEDLKRHCATLTEQLGLDCELHVTNATSAFQSVTELVSSILNDQKQFVQSEKDAMAQVISVSQQAAVSEIDRLRNQNNLLTQLLDSEKRKADALREGLVEKVSSLITEFTDSRDLSMREAITSVRRDISKGQSAMVDFGNRMEIVAKTDASARFRQVENTIDVRTGECSKIQVEGLKALSSVSTELQGGLSLINDRMIESVDDQAVALAEENRVLSTTYTAALERFDRSKRARIELTSTMELEALQGYEAVSEGLQRTSSQIDTEMHRLGQETAAISDLGEAFSSTASSSVRHIRDAANRLVREGTKDDLPTGATPRKRTYDVVEHWELTQPREEVLRIWRKGREQQRKIRRLPSAPLEDGNEESNGTSTDSPEQEAEDNDDMPIPTPISPSPAPELPTAPPPPTLVHPTPVLRQVPTAIRKPTPLSSRTTTTTALGKVVKGREKMIPLAERPTNVPRDRTRRGVGGAK